MDAPCTCGHSRREHGKQQDRGGDMACDRCDCDQYEPDPSFMEVLNRRFVDQRRCNGGDCGRHDGVICPDDICDFEAGLLD